MDFKLPIELEIRLKINDFEDKDIGDKIFKPKHVDEKLGDKIYFTDKYVLSAENFDNVNLSFDKPGLKNDVDGHRYILSSKSKMREFLVKMQTGDRQAKGERYAAQSVDEAQKKLKKAKEKGNKSDKEIDELKKILDVAKKTLDTAKKTIKANENGSSDGNSKIEIIETNLKFVLKTFFAKKTNIKISPNNFIIYSSGIGEGKISDAKDSDKKGSKPSELIKQTTTFNIKIFDEKDKVTRIDMAKMGCKERAERIEKDVFELLGISVDLFQNSNVYNPVNIFNKLREDSSKKDLLKTERDRIALERERAKREEKDSKKRAKKKLKEERDNKRNRIDKGTIDYEEYEEEEESDEDEIDDLEGEALAKVIKRDLKKRRREDKDKGKDKGKGSEKEEQSEEDKSEKEEQSEEDNPEKEEQSGGYKYSGKSARKDNKTRRKISKSKRKTPKSKRKTRRKYI